MSGSKLVRNIVESSLIPLNSLLLFFLIFEPRIMLPGWLQVFGRMHPLALHFPIVLVLLYAVMTLFFPAKMRKEHWYVSALNALLLAAAFTASITVLMGFALSRNEGYDPDALAIHKWTGVLIPFLLHFLFIIRKRIIANMYVARGVSLGVAVLISVAGHHGAIITHGENFILAPITPVNLRVVPAFEDAYVYADLVQPILENKCMSCHNGKKSKGELVMDTRELFLKGGKGGVPWDTAREDLGLLMARVHLPLNDKEHMPPKGKPQLDDDEMFILHEWISMGANFEEKFTNMLPSDTLYAIGKSKLPSASVENYDFPAADESVVSGLNNNNRVVTPVAMGSPALSATFYNSALFKIQSLRELDPVADKIVELNLEKMDVKDEDITIISKFTNLRRLNLNFTKVTGKTLPQLKPLEHLKSISLAGSPVEYTQLRALQDFPKLKEVYIWSTPAASEDLEDLKKNNKNIAWYAGFKGDTVILQLTPPILENEEEIIADPIALKLKHYINGTQIRYTLNGKEPDSVSSAVYKPGVMLDSNVTVKAKAFKPGWISSEVMEYHFYKKKFIPDSIRLLTATNKKYGGVKGRTINDNEKINLDINSGKWLGFDKQPFEAIVRFDEPVSADNVTFRTLNDIGAWIFPPTKIEVWGSNTPGDFKLLSTMIPKQPDTIESRKIVRYECRFKPATVRYLKLVAKPVTSLPRWHPEKGKNGYFFVDEIFVN
jgi:hypothetical protein